MPDDVSLPTASRLANHWYDRAGWRPGRLFDTWHLLFDESPQVRSLAARCRGTLRGLPGLAYVEDEWLHMTVQGVGWTDTLSDRAVCAVIQEAASELRGVNEFEIVIGPPLVKGEALVLAATPTGSLNELRDHLRVAVEQALGHAPWTAAEQVDGFLPHISIAYAHCDADAAPYADALRKVSHATVRVPIRHVALIRQERQLHPNWRYVWTELARITLTSTRQ